MCGSERRRQTEPERAAALRRGLTVQQLATLVTLEGFQWTLAFVRRPMFQDPVPVVFDRSSNRYVVIEPDGRINETPGLIVRA
jgi:hypothetical protein